MEAKSGHHNTTRAGKALYIPAVFVSVVLNIKNFNIKQEFTIYKFLISWFAYTVNN